MRTLTPEEYAERFFDKPWGPVSLPERDDVTLPHRRCDTHKYNYGRVVIIAGSRGYSGAPILAANACERAGAGLTQLFVPESIYEIAAMRCDGAVVRPLPEQDGVFSTESADMLEHYLTSADAVVIGPGLGSGAGVDWLVHTAFESVHCPLVVDADAITSLMRRPYLRKMTAAQLLFTPHEGEFKRMGGDLSSGRIRGAREFCRRNEGEILVLKGHGTVVARNEELTVNPTGTPAMAKGGSGDVLCGVLSALLAQRIEPLQAARTAVYLHGRAGELAEKTVGEYSLAPSDIIAHLPEAFGEVIK